VTDDVVSTSSSSDTAQRIDVVRQLNALDTLVEQATTPRAMLSRNLAHSGFPPKPRVFKVGCQR
jgi:hypothetical protein